MKCVGFGSKVKAPDGKEVIGCDTAYAVFKNEFLSTWQSITSVQTLIDIVEGYDLNYLPDIVLTGGEPLIYANDELFVTFLEYLAKKSHRITFETNGAIDVNFEKYPVYKSAVFALSVKLSSSGEPKEKRINSKALSNIIENAQDSFYKFTVSAKGIKSSHDEITEITSVHPKRDIYCMPLSDSKQSIEQGCESVIEFCKTEGYIYSDRLHIRIWDQIQGV